MRLRKRGERHSWYSSVAPSLEVSERSKLMPLLRTPPGVSSPNFVPSSPKQLRTRLQDRYTGRVGTVRQSIGKAAIRITDGTEKSVVPSRRILITKFLELH